MQLKEIPIPPLDSNIIGLSRANKHSEYSYYKYIKYYIWRYWEFPSYSQVSKWMGMNASKSVVHRIVNKLRSKGLLKVKTVLTDEDLL